MTKSEGMTKPEWTKPATAQLRGFGYSGFGFLSSFVIRHSTLVRVLSVPLLAGVRGGFMVPIRESSVFRCCCGRTEVRAPIGFGRCASCRDCIQHFELEPGFAVRRQRASDDGALDRLQTSIEMPNSRATPPQNPKRRGASLP